MRLAREEIFGPVAPIFSFKDEAEAIRMANDTEFRAGCLFLYIHRPGLACGEALDYGMVGIIRDDFQRGRAFARQTVGTGTEGSKSASRNHLEIKYLAMGRF